MKKRIKKICAAAAAVLLFMQSLTASADEPLRGDMNSDGRVNVRDCSGIARELSRGGTLPPSADYNLDGEINVRDAASLARALAIGCVQTYASASICAGIRCGMTRDEVFEFLGNGYRYSYPALAVKDSTTYVYNLKRIPVLGVDIPSDLALEFDSDDILYNIAYHIGRTSTAENGGAEYACGSDVLLPLYNDIMEELSTRFGRGRDTHIGVYAEGAEHEWAETDYGSIWMMYGTDLWMKDSGINEIIVSCYSYEFAPSALGPSL